MTKDETLKKFVAESGFKILAFARLSSCEYSVCLYLLNCAVSGLDQIITTETELASLMGYDEATLRETLNDLNRRHFIRLHYGDVGKGDKDHPSLRVGLQFDIRRWVLGYEPDATSQDAIVFPFRRQGQATLKIMDSIPKEEKRKAGEDEATWTRVLRSYTQNRNLDDNEVERAEEAAKVLVDTHPVDQCLLMIRHFGARIPTLSLLASSWQHYQEIFEAETHKIDLLDARQKHEELDLKVRDAALLLLAKRDDEGLTEEEVTVLQILTKHRHPRRQLFWAYQVRSRYPHLEGFFTDNAHMMLPVTTGGTVVRNKHD